MSRYKDHRGPKRRGFDDDYAPDYQGADRQPEYLIQGSEAVEGPSNGWCGVGTKAQNSQQ
jgi:hypothetical protein